MERVDKRHLALMAFTILICSLLTSLSLSAPVSRPSFAFSDPKIPHTFSGRNTSRTWAHTSRGSKSPDFPLSHVADSIHHMTRWPLLLPNSQCCHSNSMPHGLPAMPCTWRRDSLSTFRIYNHNKHRRWNLDAGRTTVPYRHVRDL